MIDAVVLGRWAGGDLDALSDIYAWAIANDEALPDGTFGKYEDLTGQLKPMLRAIKVYAARLQITEATAQHFANDSRFFILGYRRLDDDTGAVLSSNWDEPLAVADRQRALDYLTAQGYTLGQITSRFDATDTRAEIAEKLRTLFRED